MPQRIEADVDGWNSRQPGGLISVGGFWLICAGLLQHLISHLSVYLAAQLTACRADWCFYVRTMVECSPTDEGERVYTCTVTYKVAKVADDYLVKPSIA